MAITLILALNVLVFVGVNAARILFSLYGLNLGAGPGDVGAILATLYLFPLFLSWPMGVLSDRVGARWLLAGGVAAGAAGMLIPFLQPSLGALYLAAALLGITMLVLTVMGQHLVGALSQPHERNRNFNNYSMTGSAAMLLGPLFAGFAIDHFGHAWACLAVSALLVAASLAAALWGKTLPRSARRTAAGGNLLHTLKDRRLWKVLGISSLAQLGNDLFQAFLPIYAHGLGMNASTIGAMLAALAVGSFAVRLAMMRLIVRLGERRLMAAAFALGAVSFMLVPLVQAPAALGALAFAYGLSLGCTQPLSMILMYNSAEVGRAGEAVGLRLTVNNIARVVGPALFGAIGAGAGLFTVYWLNGMLMAGGARLTASLKRRTRAGL